MRNYFFSEQQIAKAKGSFVFPGLKTDKRNYYKVEWSYWIYGRYQRKIFEEVIYDKEKDTFNCTCKFGSLYPGIRACFHVKAVMDKMEFENGMEKYKNEAI